MAEMVQTHRENAGATVLVVEDEFIIRDLMVELLTDDGYTVLDAGDGPAALALLESGRKIDLLITDVRLPGLDGRALADAARQLWPDVKILLVTGFADKELASGLLPGMAIILKPFEMEALLSQARQMVHNGTLA